MLDASRLTPETPQFTIGGCITLRTGILTGAQLTLSRHYRVDIWQNILVLGVHESPWVRDRLW